MITFMDTRDRIWFSFLLIKEHCMRIGLCYFCIFLSVACHIQDSDLSSLKLYIFKCSRRIECNIDFWHCSGNYHWRCRQKR